MRVVAILQTNVGGRRQIIHLNGLLSVTAHKYGNADAWFLSGMAPAEGQFVEHAGGAGERSRASSPGGLLMNPSAQPFISERHRRNASMKNTSGQGQTWSRIVNLIFGMIQVTRDPGVSPRHDAIADKRPRFSK